MSLCFVIFGIIFSRDSVSPPRETRSGLTLRLDCIFPPPRNSEGEEKSAAVFQTMQLDPTFVNGDLAYMRAGLFAGARLCITACGLTGEIIAVVVLGCGGGRR